jgi:uncharacterized SAM-binding protein YcdF (DUF218 family)
MPHALSTIVWFLVAPSSALMLLLAIGLWRARRSGTVPGRLGWATLAAVLLLVAGLSPAATVLMLPLEQRFPRFEPQASSTDYTGIIVLGGGEDTRTSAARGQLQLNEAGERITEGARLARLLPATKLVFSGGGAMALLPDQSAGGLISGFWQAMGIASERILVEDRSLTTYENARETYALLHPKAGERWLLVTSAAHMPRAVGVFRKAGFDVVPCPVDYRTRGPSDLLLPFKSLPGGWKQLDDATREWVGLAGYRLLGRTDALFPEPGR